MYLPYSTQTVIAFILAGLPLFAAIVLIARKLYQQEAMACFLLICILSGARELLQSVSPSQGIHKELTENIFVLLNFGLVLLACKPLVKNPAFRLLIPSAIFFFSGIFVTLLLLTGLQEPQTGFRVAACMLILAVSLFAIIRMIHAYQLSLLTLPLFWMAGGIFFFHFQYLIVHLGTALFFTEDPAVYYHSWLIMLMSKVITYAFFLVAVFSTPGRMKIFAGKNKSALH